MSGDAKRKLRILHVGNFGFKTVKLFLHGVAAKLSSGWSRGGHHVINFSDRDIARWTGFGHRLWGARSTNRILKDFCAAADPDVLALGHADVITAETIAAIKAAQPRLKILQWNVDPLVTGHHASAEDNRARLRSKMELVDATFVSTPGEPLKEFAAPGRITGFLPNPVDPSFERGRNFELADLPNDVFLAVWIGSERRYHAGDWRVIDEFATEMMSKLPGSRFSLHGVLGQPRAEGPTYERAILSARIGLNISKRNDVHLYSSDRLAHLAGNGLAVCIDRASGYGELIGEDGLVLYSSEGELFETLARLKSDDGLRRKIAEKGWRRYHELFDSAIIGQYMLDALYGRHEPQRFAWPTLV